MDQRNKKNKYLLRNVIVLMIAILIIGGLSYYILLLSKTESVAKFECSVLSSILLTLEEVEETHALREKSVMKVFEKQAVDHGFVIVEASIADVESKEVYNRISSGRKILSTGPLSNSGRCEDWRWVDRTYLGKEGRFNVTECETIFRKQGIKFSIFILLRKSTEAVKMPSP